jgi:methyl-accepting chemotaxis protein WspA
MSLRRLSLRAKLQALVAVFVIGLVVTHVMYGVMLSKLSIGGSLYNRVVQGKDIVADVLPPPEYIIESYLTVLQLLEEKDAVLQKTFLDRFAKLKTEYYARHHYWVDTLHDPELRRALTDDSYKFADEFYVLADKTVMEPLKAGQPASELPATVRTALRDKYEQHRKAVDEVVRLAVNRNAVDEELARTTTQLWITLQVLFFAAITIAAGALGWFIYRSLTRPLAELIERMTEMSSGAADLTKRVEVTSEDEIGRLATLINSVIQRIHDLIARARIATIQLNSTATEIAASANQQVGTLQSFAASSSQIAAAVKEISASGQGLVRTTEEVDARAASASTLAEAGRTGLTGMTSTMQQLSDASGSISGKLSTIREKAGSINVVVTTITKVADQTNLLSINAAIEAEKAGESGRGFLVVAREIRRLADQTAVATLDIEQMVRQMQAAVSTGVMEMDHFTDKVRGCITQVSQIGSQMEQVINDVASLSRNFQTVNESMRQQAQGVQQIDDVMLQLTTGVKQVSSSVQDFQQAAENLRESARVLQREVGQFTVGG